MPEESADALAEALQQSIDARLAALGPAVPTSLEQATEWAESADPAMIEASVDLADVSRIVLETDTALLLELRREIRSLRQRVARLEG